MLFGVRGQYMNKNKLYLILTYLIMIFVLIISYVFTSKKVLEPEINDSNKTIYLGYENYQIECTKLLPDTILTFKSSNEEIAMVDEIGLVRPVSTGIVDIYIKIKQKRKTYNFKATITICDPYILISNKISEIIRTDNYKFQIETKGLRNPDIIWSVSDDSIGVINPDNGIFYAKDVGQIIVTAQDRNSQATSVCYVDVIKIPFRIADKSDEYWCGVSYKLKTEGTDALVDWSVSDSEVASIDKEGIFFAKKEGNVTITALDTSSGEISSYRVTTKDIEESPVEIFDIATNRNNEAWIIGIKDKSYSEIKIPVKYNGIDIVGLSFTGACEPQITKIIIPSNIKHIAEESLSYSENLESIVIQDRDSRLNFCLASDCKKLIEYITPYKCEIRYFDYSFYNNISLKKIVLHEDAQLGILMFGGVDLKGFIIEELEVVITNSVNKLIEMFGYVVNLKITIPANVTYIDPGCFSVCKYVVIYTPKNSVAEQYAKENGIPYVNY